MISKNKKLLNQEILKSSIKGAFIKLNPAYMMKNPVMFVVEVGFTITSVSYTHLTLPTTPYV